MKCQATRCGDFSFIAFMIWVVSQVMIVGPESHRFQCCFQPRFQDYRASLGASSRISPGRAAVAVPLAQRSRTWPGRCGFAQARVSENLTLQLLPLLVFLKAA
jgi:hypothetical protein